MCCCCQYHKLCATRATFATPCTFFNKQPAGKNKKNYRQIKSINCKILSYENEELHRHYAIQPAS